MSNSLTGYIDNTIGSAFPVVQAVANALPEIKHVSANLEKVYAVGNNTESLLNLYDHLDEMISIGNTIISFIDDFNEVQDSLERVQESIAEDGGLHVSFSNALNSVNHFHLQGGSINGGPVLAIVSDNDDPTPSELAAHIGAQIAFIDDNPSKCPAELGLIYAWNEFDEGGWLCPTIDDQTGTRLQVVADVINS